MTFPFGAIPRGKYDAYPVQNGPFVLDNFLTFEQASFEGGTTVGWGTPVNCTFANSTAQASDGIRSIALTCTSGPGNMSVSTPGGLNGFPVTPNTPYTVLAWFRSATFAPAGQCIVSINWFDNTGASGGVGSPPFPTVDNNSTWTVCGFTGTSFPNSAFASITLLLQNAATSEIHYIDHVRFGLAR